MKDKMVELGAKEVVSYKDELLIDRIIDVADGNAATGKVVLLPNE
jgi:hypothetical protein